MNLGEKLVQAGSVISGLGGAASVGFWIFVLQSESVQSFWTVAGVSVFSVMVLGLLLLAAGLLVRGEQQAPRQGQSGGDGSVNFQAGRDIKGTEIGDGYRNG